MAQLQLRRPIVFFDLETTGTSIARDRIIEMALVKLNIDGSREKKVRRLNPGMPIPPEATAVHGISDEDVKDCPGFRQVAKSLYEWLRGCDFAGYNVVRFDLPMLVEEFLRAGVNVDFNSRRIVDAQQIFFKMEQRTLSAAVRFYCGKELEGAHGAEADTLATIEVLEAQMDHYSELQGDVEWLHQHLCGEEDCVDYDRKMIRRNGVEIFNFGQHKGKPVRQVLTDHPGYYGWIMDSDFTLHTKQKLAEIYTEMKLGSVVSKKGAKTVAVPRAASAIPS
jgi:DNA polymerase-3 subunit epsilon